MRATAELKKEHRAVKTMMQILEQMCQNLENDKTVPAEHLDQVIEFIRVFTDKCHHGKEEELLFPALEAVGIPNQSGPIGVMLQEHGTMRSIIAKLADAIEDYKRDNPEAADQIVASAREYMTWLNGHIDKEENILFMMADARLDEATQDALYEDFEKLEEERIGRGVHEKFHENLHALMDIYLEKPDIDSSTTSNDDEQKLVATKIPPRIRHPKILETFHALQPGTSFILENDHDPKPLYYQFEAELPGQFSWEYLQEGPETWQVRIGKTASA